MVSRMARILIRAHKAPFVVADAETTYEKNTIGNNTGNLVFSQSVYRLLSVAGNDLSTSGLAKTAASKINDNYDHVVIPLANAFRPGYTTLEALADLIEQLTIPVTVVGVGAQASIDGDYRDHDWVAAATTRFVEGRAEPLGLDRRTRGVHRIVPPRPRLRRRARPGDRLPVDVHVRPRFRGAQEGRRADH